MQEIKVKPGYKMTELGVIPEDWDLVRIGDSFKFKNGLNKAKEFFGYGTPIINYMDVYKHFGIEKENIKGKVSLTTDEMKNFSIQKGDVLFTRTSETVDEIGVSAVVTGDVENTVFSGFVLRARPYNDLFSNEFKKYCFGTGIARKQIISKSTYTTRALTNGRVLSDVKIPIPKNKEEQNNIAISISDIINLVNSFNDLINKKEKLKEGTMQELLTGKRRLPGFKLSWSVEKLSNLILKITTGKLDANAMSSDGIYPFFTCSREIYKINRYSFEGESLLISGNGFVGDVKYYYGKFDAYQRTYVLQNFIGSAKYMYYYLKIFLPKRVLEETNTGAMPFIKMSTLTDMNINIPLIDEQEAIANVLSDMDNEIENLKTKRDKYIKIKEGMMQELLTGKTRLV